MTREAPGVTFGAGSRTILAHHAKAESLMKLKLAPAVAVIILTLAELA